MRHILLKFQLKSVKSYIKLRAIMIRFHFRLQSKISIKYGRDQKRPVNKHTLLKKLSKVFNVYRQIDFIYIYSDVL